MDTPLLAESWLLALDAEGAAAGTLRAYRVALAALAAHLGGTDYTDATKDDIRRWVAGMRGTLAQNTVRQRVKIAKAFYRWLAAEEEMIGRPDPMAGVKAPAEIRPDIQTLSEAEVRALIDACAGAEFEARRDAAILMVLIDGGLRREECASLRLEDVDLRAGTIHVVGKGSRMRGPRHRVVGVGRRTCLTVDRYLRARARVFGGGTTDALWISRRTKGAMTSAGIRHVVEGRGRQAGVRLHAHVLRHTWASEFRSNGGNEGDLMLQGGWSNRRELDRYGRHVAATRATEAGRRLSLADRLR